MTGPSRRTVLQSLGGTMAGLSLAGCIGSPQAAETDSLVRWRYSTGGFLDQYVDFDPETCFNCDGVNAPPTVIDGTVYVASDKVYALDAADGSEQWTTNTGTPVDTVERRNDAVYAVSGVEHLGGDDYALYCLDLTTGEERWQFASPSAGAKLNLLGVDDAVYVGTSTDVVCSTSVYAVNGDGTQRWESDSCVFGNVVVGGDTLYVAGRGVDALATDDGELRWQYDEDDSTYHMEFLNDRLYVDAGSGVSALDPADGTTSWHFEPDESYVTEWAFTADSVVAGTDAGIVYELDSETGERRWTVTTDDRLHSLTANREFVFTGTISTADHESKPAERTAVLRAIDATDGTEVWTRTPVGTFTNEGGIYSLAVENGRVYASIATDEGDTAILLSLDAATGEERWRFEPDDGFLTLPTITDTGVYVGSENGDVYALPE